jgi:hypothetical protein
MEILDAMILDLKSAIIAGEHVGTRAVKTAKLREILDHYEPLANGNAMGKLHRPARIIGGLSALRSPTPSAPRTTALPVTDQDVERLIESVAFVGSHEDEFGALVVASRDRVAMAKDWMDRKDSIPEAARAEFWQWAFEATDRSINGELAAHLQPGIVRRQAC